METAVRPGTSDKVGSLVLEIDDVKKRIACLETECAKEKELLEKCLCAIEDAHTRMIFRLRFLHCMTWAQVADTIGGVQRGEHLLILLQPPV